MHRARSRSPYRQMGQHAPMANMQQGNMGGNMPGKGHMQQRMDSHPRGPMNPHVGQMGGPMGGGPMDQQQQNMQQVESDGIHVYATEQDMAIHQSGGPATIRFEIEPNDVCALVGINGQKFQQLGPQVNCEICFELKFGNNGPLTLVIRGPTNALSMAEERTRQVLEGLRGIQPKQDFNNQQQQMGGQQQQMGGQQQQFGGFNPMDQQQQGGPPQQQMQQMGGPPHMGGAPAMPQGGPPQRQMSQVNMPPLPAAGANNSSELILEISEKLAGAFIGNAGCNLTQIQAHTGANIKVPKEINAGMRQVKVTGRPESVQKAQMMIEEWVMKHDPVNYMTSLRRPDGQAVGSGGGMAALQNGSAPGARGPGPGAAITGAVRVENSLEPEQSTYDMPERYLGLIVGPKGSTINTITQSTGADLQFLRDKQNSGMVPLTIKGRGDQIQRAVEMVSNLLTSAKEDGRLTNPDGSHMDPHSAAGNFVGRICFTRQDAQKVIGLNGQRIKTVRSECDVHAEIENSGQENQILVLSSNDISKLRGAEKLVRLYLKGGVPEREGYVVGRVEIDLKDVVGFTGPNGENIAAIKSEYPGVEIDIDTSTNTTQIVIQSPEHSQIESVVTHIVAILDAPAAGGAGGETTAGSEAYGALPASTSQEQIMQVVPFEDSIGVQQILPQLSNIRGQTGVTIEVEQPNGPGESNIAKISGMQHQVMEAVNLVTKAVADARAGTL